MSDSVGPNAAPLAPAADSRLRPAVWALVLGSALILRLFVAREAPLIEVDGAYWLILARSLANGDMANGLSSAWPPLFPAVVALAFRGLAALGAPETPATLEWAGRLVSVIAGTLTLLPLHAIARRLLPPPGPALVLVLAAVTPRLVEYSAAALSESLFTLVLVTAVAAVTAGSFEFAGALFGFAFLARPEGLLLGFATWAAAVWRAPAGTALFTRLRPIFLVALLVVSLPWVNFVHRRTGEWSLGEKGAYNFWRAHRSAFARHFPPPRALPERVNRSPEIAPAAIRGEVKPLALIAAEPVAVLVTTARHLFVLVFSTYPVTIGWPLAVLAVAGLFVARAGPWWAVFAPLAAAPLVLAPFTVDRRLLVPLVPLALPLAAAAALAGLRRRPGRMATGVVALLVAGLLGYALAIPSRMETAPEHRAAGEWLRAHRGRGRAVLARKPQIAFYAEGIIADLPDGPLDSVRTDAKLIDAVLVVDGRSIRGDRPQLAFWLDPAWGPEEFHLIHRMGGEDPVLLWELVHRP